MLKEVFPLLVAIKSAVFDHHDTIKAVLADLRIQKNKTQLVMGKD